MKFIEQARNNKVMTVVGVCLGTLFVCFLLRGWIREPLIPNYVSWRYTDTIAKTFDDAKQQLSPLSRLGINLTESSEAGCSKNYAQYFMEEVGCAKYEKGSVAITQDYLARRVKDVEAWQKGVEQDGWKNSHSDATTSSLAELLAHPDTTLNTGGYYGYVRFDKEINGLGCYIGFSRYDNDFGYVLSCAKTIRLGIA